MVGGGTGGRPPDQAGRPRPDRGRRRRHDARPRDPASPRAGMTQITTADRPGVLAGQVPAARRRGAAPPLAADCLDPRRPRGRLPRSSGSSRFSPLLAVRSVEVVGVPDCGGAGRSPRWPRCPWAHRWPGSTTRPSPTGCASGPPLPTSRSSAPGPAPWSSTPTRGCPCWWPRTLKVNYTLWIRAGWHTRRSARLREGVPMVNAASEEALSKRRPAWQPSTSSKVLPAQPPAPGQRRDRERRQPRHAEGSGHHGRVGRGGPAREEAHRHGRRCSRASPKLIDVSAPDTPVTR